MRRIKIMEELLKILNEVKPGVDYENETDLIGHGVLDSITMVTLVLQISDEFDVDISLWISLRKISGQCRLYMIL